MDVTRALPSFWNIKVIMCYLERVSLLRVFSQVRGGLLRKSHMMDQSVQFGSTLKEKKIQINSVLFLFVCFLFSRDASLPDLFHIYYALPFKNRNEKKRGGK